MKDLTKKMVNKGSKEALNITTRGLTGSIADVAKESIKDEIQRSGVSDSVIKKISKSMKKLVKDK
ncbi:MAG: hypothetical protein EAX86_01995 [Candidatus Heimdallarchaeota archaeon]|nr:hypothetical protein [Candidatus Heimdallarchaeota archaeon]